MKETSQKVAMEFSSFFFHLLFFGLIFQLSNTIVSSAKEIPAQNALTDKLDSLIEQIPSFNSLARTFNNSHPTDIDIGKRLVQQRIKRDTDDDTDDDIDHVLYYIDHSESGCLAEEPRNQLGCDASYAFATIAFYEWLNCQRTGQFKAFSEQYLIDCSHRQGNAGCNGGHPIPAMMFVKDCGLEFRDDYPYTGRAGICPYDDSTPSANMGALRIDQPIVKYIALDRHQLKKYLEYGPIIAVIEGSNVNVEHTVHNIHVILIIGDTREDDIDYWLVRDSRFGSSGDDGPDKMEKNVGFIGGIFGIALSGPIL